MNIIKKTFEKISKEYILLFLILISVGLLIFSSMGNSQQWQNISVNTFFPAPFGEFVQVRAFRFIDYDSPGRYVDPDGQSRMQSLYITNGIRTRMIRGIAGGNNPTYFFNTGNGRGKMNSVRAEYFYQVSQGPSGGVNARRGQGKFVYGVNDIAEGIQAKDCEAGDVVIINSQGEDDFIKSSLKFDARVAGVISESPAIYMGQHKDNFPLALEGLVKCKATTENGKIRRGDLLVSSSLPGHAMKAKPKNVKPGMLIGKALQPLKEKTGFITILINKN